MPLTFDRRDFLKTSLATFALSEAADGADDSVHVALLADTHIAANPNDRFGSFSPHMNIRKVSAMVEQAKPQLLIVNGDLARANGQAQDYAALNEYLNPLAQAMPMIVTLGNHDDREHAREALAKLAGDRQAVVQKLVTVMDAGPCTMVLLDSLMITNIAAGLVGKAQRDWLAEYLARPAAKPIVVFVHHNPDGDSDGALLDADRLLAIVTPNRNVKALIFGHTHVYSLTKASEMHLINLPAVGYNFAEGNPVGWVDAVFGTSGVTLRLHAVAGEMKDDGQTTKLEWRS